MTVPPLEPSPTITEMTKPLWDLSSSFFNDVSNILSVHRQPHVPAKTPGAALDQSCLERVEVSHKVETPSNIIPNVI